MKKTLVCVICQTHSWELTWSGFKRLILDELHADLAVCISTTESYNYDNPFWNHAKYKITFPEYNDLADGFDYIQDYELDFTKYIKPNWREILEIDSGNWLGGIYKNGTPLPSKSAIVWIARWHLLQCIKAENLFDKYDRIIITRSDYMHTLKHPSMKWLDPKYIWVPDGEGNGGITDKHAVLSKHNYEYYLNMVAELVTEPNVYIDSMKGQVWNRERFLRYHLSKHHCAIKFYPYHMYTVRQVNENLDWHKASFSSEHGHYVKYDHEYISTISLSNHIDTQEGWNNIIVKKTAMNCFNSVLVFDNNVLIYDNSIDNYRLARSEENYNQNLILDCKNGEGEIFAGTIHMGLFERFPVVKVFVNENSNGTFTMMVRDSGQFLAIQNNMLVRVNKDSLANDHKSITFNLENRYHKVLQSMRWHKQ